MPNFHYTARDERGNAVSGTLNALSSEALADQLKRMGYLVTRSREAADGGGVEDVLQRLRGVSDEDMVLFSVQLSKMVQVGIPLVTALQTLIRQTVSPRLREAVGDAARSIEAGSSFSEALAKHPRIFSPLFINMVRAGEVSGKLDEILRRLAVFAKSQAELREQLKTAMTYPVLLLVVGLGVMAFLVMGIIPKFMHIFLEAGVTLPLPTQLLYEASQWLRRYGLILLGALLAAGIGLERYARTPDGRRRLDTAVLTIPVVGDLARKAALSRFSRALETLLSSGVSILESLAIAEQTCGNTVIADACRTAQTSVRQGGTMTDALKVNAAFPPMVVQMVMVGESSGTLSQMLGEIAEHFDDLVRHGLKRATTLVEPLFLMVMGGMVAFIMASILLPLFRMVNVIH